MGRYAISVLGNKMHQMPEKQIMLKYKASPKAGKS